MPADLDRLFAAFGAHADTVPLHLPAQARRRGERWRRRRLTAAALVMALVVGGVIIGTVRLASHPAMPSGPANPPPTVKFRTLESLGDPVALDLRGGLAMAAIVGDRAFVGGLSSDRHLRVAALDLGTGRPAWPAVDLGSYGDWRGLAAGPDRLAVVGEHGGPGSDGVITVLDPTTGAKRWQREITHGTSVFYGSTVVLQDLDARVVTGLSWSDGTVLWSLPGMPRLLRDLDTSWSLPRSAVDLGTIIDQPDDRLLDLAADGTLKIYNGQTGQLVGAREHAKTPGIQYQPVAYDGVLYTTIGNPGTRVEAAEIAGTQPATTIYTAREGERIHSVVPCGPGRVCIAGDDQRANGAGLLISVEVATGRELWRRPVENFASVSSVWQRILTGRGQIFDLDGHVLVEPIESETVVRAGWVGPGSVLLFTARRRGQLQVTGLTTVNGSRVELGQIPSSSGYCAFTATVLVCPDSDGIHAWSFAT